MNGVKQPHVGAVSPGIHFIGPAPEGDVKLFLKHYFATDMYCQRFFLKHIATTITRHRNGSDGASTKSNLTAPGSILLQAGTKTPTSFGAPSSQLWGPSTHTKPLARAGENALAREVLGSRPYTAPIGERTPLAGSAEKQKGRLTEGRNPFPRPSHGQRWPEPPRCRYPIASVSGHFGRIVIES